MSRSSVVEGEVVDDDFDDEDDEDAAGPGRPNLAEALLGHAIHRGTEQIKSKMREAAGKLDPHRIGLTGVVEDVPSPGMLEMRVSVPGAKPVTVIVPYVHPKQAAAQDEHARSLIGHTIRLILEIER